MTFETAKYPSYQTTDYHWLPAIPSHWEVRRCRFVFREVDQRSIDGRETHLGDVPEHWRARRLKFVANNVTEQTDVQGTGFESNQGFVVQAGSQAVVATTPSIKSFENSIRLRQDLIANGVLAREGDVYRFSQDFIFSSPSAASDLVLGSVTNGRTSWKDVAGRTLKELQAAEAGQ